VRARTYGLALLIAVGLVPLGVFGYLAVTRSERGSIRQVQNANRRLARLVAERVAAYVESERKVLTAIGAAALLAHDPSEAAATLQAYGLEHQYFHRLEVYRKAGVAWAAQEGPARDAQTAELVARALAGQSARSGVSPARAHRAGAFAHTMMLAEPVVIAGRREGAVVAELDMVGIWPPINSVRVGRTGFVRLLTVEGELLAHGDPEERRFVFSEDPDGGAALIVGALLEQVVANQQGDKVVASLAFVPGLDWVVVVEQAVDEAFEAPSVIRRTLIIFAAAALAAVLLLGLLLGRSVVRGLEELREHTRVLADGELDARVQPDSRLVEVRALARALNDMAASLSHLQEQARARDRMATFAQISAGLAHDLKAPIEAVRGAFEALQGDPTDESVQQLVHRVRDRDLPRLKDYMDDLHRLSARGDLGREIARVAPAGLVADLVEDLRAIPKWREVSFVGRGEAAEVSMDRKLVRRAVYNLAANGADACLEAADAGTVTIEVEGKNGEVAFRVIDTGIGISPDRVEKLATVDFSSTKRSTGVGLGLGVVRQIAQAHGGRLEIESEEGAGSTFSLVLSRSGKTSDQPPAAS